MTFPLPGANWSYLHGLRLVATTGAAGFVLQNATPTLLTWTAPNDGDLHSCYLELRIASGSVSPTGGDLKLLYESGTGNRDQGFSVSGTAANNTIFYVGGGPVFPGEVVALEQYNAVTAGSATAWAQVWAY